MVRSSGASPDACETSPSKPLEGKEDLHILFLARKYSKGVCVTLLHISAMVAREETIKV